MLTIILLFIRAFSLNPILELQYACESVGTDLINCNDTCTFYRIASRRIWTIGSRLNVAVRASVGSRNFSWFTGNVTRVFGDQLTVALDNCDEDSDMECDVTNDRYAFVFRDLEPKEFVGMRIEVWRSYFNRWITTNLTAIQDDKWKDLWAYGGEFGNMVGLQPFDIKAYSSQSCVFDHAQIRDVAEKIRVEANQVPEAIYCTQIYDEVLCSDDYNLNCEWNSTLSACVLNQETDDLIRCFNRTSTTCTQPELQAELTCKWLEGSHDDGKDGLCVNSSAALSIVFLTIFVLLFM